jgi:hypothetical protein
VCLLLFSFTEFHTYINGMYMKCSLYFHIIDKQYSCTEESDGRGNRVVENHMENDDDDVVSEVALVYFCASVFFADK